MTGFKMPSSVERSLKMMFFRGRMPLERTGGMLHTVGDHYKEKEVGKSVAEVVTQPWWPCLQTFRRLEEGDLRRGRRLPDGWRGPGRDAGQQTDSLEAVCAGKAQGTKKAQVPQLPPAGLKLSFSPQTILSGCPLLAKHEMGYRWPWTGFLPVLPTGPVPYTSHTLWEILLGTVQRNIYKHRTHRHIR